MDASFLRASLFTSVVAFGVAALVAGLGIMFILLGLALLGILRRLPALEAPASPFVKVERLEPSNHHAGPEGAA